MLAPARAHLGALCAYATAVVAAGAVAGLVGRRPDDGLSPSARLLAERRLVQCCDWALAQQDSRGLFTRKGANAHAEWYQNAYLARALLAAAAHLDRPRYRQAAFRLCDRFVAQQQPDGSWLADEGPPAPGQPYGDTRNLADVSTMVTTLVMAACAADPPRRARYLGAAQRWFHGFALRYSLRDGSWGNGVWQGEEWTAPYSCSTATMTALGYALHAATGAPFYRDRADDAAYWTAIHIRRDGGLALAGTEAMMRRARRPGAALSHGYYMVHDGLLWAAHNTRDPCLQALVRQRLEWFFAGRESAWGAYRANRLRALPASDRSKAGGFLAGLLAESKASELAAAAALPGAEDRAEWMVFLLCRPDAAGRFGFLADPAGPDGAFAAAAAGFCALGLAEACWPGASFSAGPVRGGTPAPAGPAVAVAAQSGPPP